jgi:hypothetical protein
MNSIIKDLYNGKISPIQEKPSREYFNCCRNLDEKLLEALNGNEESLNKIIDIFNQNQNIFQFLDFKQGFILGSKLMLAVLCED